VPGDPDVGRPDDTTRYHDAVVRLGRLWQQIVACVTAFTVAVMIISVPWWLPGGRPPCVYWNTPCRFPTI